MTLWSRKENIAIATEHSHLLVFGDPIFLDNAIFTDLDSFPAREKYHQQFSLIHVVSKFWQVSSTGTCLFTSTTTLEVLLIPLEALQGDKRPLLPVGSQNYSFCYRVVKVCIYANIFTCTAFACELYFKNFLPWEFFCEEFFHRLTTLQFAVITEEAIVSK